MTEHLQEYVDSRGVALRVDRAAGVLRGVKLIGLESLNGRRYRPEALAAAVSLYEGAKVNVNHPKEGPLAPGEVMLPPSVPGLPAPGADPAVAGAMSVTTEVAFDAVSDTTVFTATPNAPQSSESAELLAIGGPEGAVTLISFDVSGIGEGTVLSALLTFTGAGAAGAPGGSVGVIYDYVARDGLTANDVPDGGSALNVHGVPSWFEAVEPGGLSAVDVTGSVSADGTITFVLPGQPEAAGSIHAMESGIPPQLILMVSQPA